MNKLLNKKSSKLNNSLIKNRNKNKAFEDILGTLCCSCMHDYDPLCDGEDCTWKCIRDPNAKIEYKAGDVIVFGSRSLFSKITALFTFNTISHCAIVVTKKNDPSNTLYLYHSLVNDISNGVRCTPLQEGLDEMKKMFTWGFLLQLNDNYTRPCIDDTFDQYGYDYENTTRLFFIVTVGFEHNIRRKKKKQKEVKKYINCSELVVRILQSTDIVSTTYDASQFTPSDLCDLNIYKNEHVYYQIFGTEKVCLKM